jgi:3',5'-cyclic AMP phosphodiesterase CpdA
VIVQAAFFNDRFRGSVALYAQLLYESRMDPINLDRRQNADSQSSAADDQASSTTALAHISDPHLSCMESIKVRDLLGKRLPGFLRWKLQRQAGHSDSLLSALQTDLKKSNPDQIAVTGDLTHLSLPAEFEKAGQWLRTLGAPSRVSVIPGNHDTYVHTNWHQTMAHWTEYMCSDTARDDGRIMDNLDQVFPSLRIRGCVALIGVCTAQPSAPHLAVGSIGKIQLNRLRKILSQTARRNYYRVMLIHHPPTFGTVSWRKRLTDAHALHSLLAEFGVELILHGHSHRTHQGYLNGPSGKVPVIGATSITSLDHPPERRARYCIYHISPSAGEWNVRIRSRIYSPAEKRFVAEGEQQLG